MKKLLFIFLFIPIGLTAQNYNVISYNIRYNNPDDGINTWDNRKEMVAELLRFHETDIFGLQEALIGQLVYIDSVFVDFSWVGVGRDDGKIAGEFAPIFYNKQKFKLIDSGYFWLCEKPVRPKLGWDAACKRITTWVKLQSKSSDEKIYIINTHFDHVGVKARAESVQLIKSFIADMIKKDAVPVVLMGDFNLTPDKTPIQSIAQFLNDSKSISLAKPYGPDGTFNGFKWQSPLKNRIDYIFVNDKVKILKYAVLSDSKEQRYPSDHLPVFVKIDF